MAVQAVAPLTDVRPDRITLGAFAGVVFIGGANVVAVRISNQELDPIWGAAIRFALESLLLFATARLMRLALPRGRALVGAVLMGASGFFGAYSFLYLALRDLQASLVGPIMASVPLITFFLALAHGLERFRWRGLAGGLVSVAGIAVLSGAAISGDVPLRSVLFAVGGAVCAAESGIVVKKIPKTHPIPLNAVAMAFGTVLLMVTSFFLGETHVLPKQTDTLVAFTYLVLFGSTLLFIFFVVVVSRWTVSGASYQFVLFPIVAVILAALIANEKVTASTGLGAALVIVGVYIGALSRDRRPQSTEPPPTPVENCVSC